MSLYDEEVSNIINRIKDSIREHDMTEEDKIISKVIKEAIVQIKANKTDALLPQSRLMFALVLIHPF